MDIALRFVLETGSSLLKTVITRLNGGLGNQIFQFSAGLWLAAQHGAELRIDPSGLLNSNQRGIATKRSLDLTVAVPHHLKFFESNKDLPLSLKLAQREGASRLGTLGARIAHNLPWGDCVIARERGPALEYLSDVDSKNYVYLTGYWQDFRLVQGVAADLRRLISPKPLLSQRLQAVEQDWEKLVTVAMHVRRGDFQTAWARHHAVVDEAYFQKAVDFLKKEVGDFRLFIFSDDTDWCKATLDLPVHATYIEALPGESDFSHLWLMSKADHLVMSNSSFSWWAAWLGDADQRIVIRPQTWLRGHEPPSPIFLPKWTPLFS